MCCFYDCNQWIAGVFLLSLQANTSLPTLPSLFFLRGGFNARDDFFLLVEIRPRNKTESIAVLRYLAEEYMDRKETDAILLNLIG
jgi:hypothetical protein